MLLPFSLLCGLAADGLARGSPPVRAIAACAAAAALVFSLLTIRTKIDGLVDVGRRAHHQLHQLLSHVPEDARDMTIAIRFLESDRRPGDLYSVFRMPDNLLLVHRNVLDWSRPYRGLVLDWDVVKDFSQVDSAKFDLALGWDAQSQRFINLSNKP